MLQRYIQVPEHDALVLQMRHPLAGLKLEEEYDILVCMSHRYLIILQVSSTSLLARLHHQ